MSTPGVLLTCVPSTVPGDADLTVPTAWAILARGKYSWIWIVMTCPYCDKPHDHYGGPEEPLGSMTNQRLCRASPVDGVLLFAGWVLLRGRLLAGVIGC